MHVLAVVFMVLGCFVWEKKRKFFAMYFHSSTIFIHQTLKNLTAAGLKMFTMLHELINNQGMENTAAKQYSYTAFLSMQK